MARIPNYGQQRAERSRSKQAKAEAKQRERDARKAENRPLTEDGEPAEGDALAEADAGDQDSQGSGGQSSDPQATDETK